MDLDFLDHYADRIAASREFLTRLWNLDNDERPGFMIGYVGPQVKNGQTGRKCTVCQRRAGYRPRADS